MTTGPSQFLAQSDRFKQASSAFAHLRIGQPPELAHWDHHILLRAEVFHQEMELKNESDELAAFMRQLIIAQMQRRLRFNGNSPRIRRIEETENIEQRALAAARWADNSVDAAWLEIERDPTQRMDARLLRAQLTLD